MATCQQCRAHPPYRAQRPCASADADRPRMHEALHLEYRWTSLEAFSEAVVQVQMRNRPYKKLYTPSWSRYPRVLRTPTDIIRHITGLVAKEGGPKSILLDRKIQSADPSYNMRWRLKHVPWRLCTLTLETYVNLGACNMRAPWCLQC